MTAAREQAANLAKALDEGLRELGYVEGRNIVVERRFADGKQGRLPALAAELVRLKLDVIVAGPTSAVQAAKRATSEIPIVMTNAGEPVGTGLVTSLARPGGNVTGLSALSDELSGKRLELLKQVIPGIIRVAVLWNAGNPGVALVVKELNRASLQLGLQVHSLPVQGPRDLSGAFHAMTRWQA